jgi:hypothetical protein
MIEQQALFMFDPELSICIISAPDHARVLRDLELTREGNRVHKTSYELIDDIAAMRGVDAPMRAIRKPLFANAVLLSMREFGTVLPVYGDAWDLGHRTSNFNVVRELRGRYEDGFESIHMFKDGFLHSQKGYPGAEIFHADGGRTHHHFNGGKPCNSLPLSLSRIFMDANGNIGHGQELAKDRTMRPVTMDEIGQRRDMLRRKLEAKL